jgi:hypothetical protein
MDISHIRKILEQKMAAMKRPDLEIKKHVQQIVAQDTGINLLPEHIRIQHKIVYLKVAPIEKNTLFLQKKSILRKLSEVLGPRAPHDLK